MSDSNLMQTVERKMIFLLSLYDEKYKEKKSLNKIAKDLLDRDGVDATLRRAHRVTRRVSSSFSMSDADDVGTDVGLMKNVLEKFAIDITVILSDPTSKATSLAVRSNQFQKEWNRAITEMEGKFLKGYGDIYATDLLFKLNNVEEIKMFLTKLRKAQTIPQELALFHIKRNITAIITSFDALVEIQRFVTLKRACVK